MKPDHIRTRTLRESSQRRSPARGSVASRRGDAMFVGLTRAADRSRLWLAIAGILALAGGQRGKRAAARGLVAISLASAVTNGPLKLAFHRARPIRRPLLIRRPRSFSFPSGHSASAFAFATAASAQLPALAPLLLPLATGVAYSRVRVGVHRPSDVLLGSALGSATGIIVSSAGRPRSRPAEPPSTREPPDLPKELILVTSPHAGGSRGIDVAREEIRRLGFTIAEQVEIDEIDRLPELIRSTDTPPTLVVAAGGDGTVGAVADASSRTATAFSPCCRSAHPTTSRARSESP
jgi:membrane-associated phospholipid phosphatase